MSDATRRSPIRESVDTSLFGSRCYLKPVTPDDIPAMYLWESGSPSAFRWRLAGQHLSPQAYVETVWDGVLATFIICTLEGRPCGIATAYSADMRNQHCYAALGRFDVEPGRPTIASAQVSVEAFNLLIDFLFQGWNFVKIYLEVAEYNLPQFASLVGRACTVEGVLRDHIYLSSRRWDLHILAISREMWTSFRSRREHNQHEDPAGL